MAYTVQISSAAEQDIEHTMDYIDHVLKNPTAAKRLFSQIKVKLSSLSVMPWRCALANDPVLAAWEIRHLMIENYFAFYQIDEPNHTVHILRFLYEKSDWKNILKCGSIKYGEDLFTSPSSNVLSDVR